MFDSTAHQCLPETLPTPAHSLLESAYRWGSRATELVKEHPVRAAIVAGALVGTAIALKTRAACAAAEEIADIAGGARLEADAAIGLKFPTQGELLSAPEARLFEQFQTNQQALTDYVAANQQRIPFIGFHGASAQKFDYMLRAAETEEGAGIQTATFFRKSDEPQKLLADIGKAAKYADGYTLSNRVESIDRLIENPRRGPIAVLDFSSYENPIFPGNLRAVQKFEGVSHGQYLWPGAEHFGHKFVRLTPQNFSQIYRGAVTPSMVAEFELPATASADRKTIAGAFKLQKNCHRGT
jgi:hypothetical protein